MNTQESDRLFEKVTIPILLLVGLFGNSLSIRIFSKKSFLKSSTFEYLKLISIVDLFTLLIGCLQTLLEVYFKYNIKIKTEFTCKLYSFLVYYFTHLSSMLLSVLSIDRCIRILINKNKSIFIPRKQPIKVFLGLAITLFLINSPFLIYSKIIDSNNSTIIITESTSSINVDSICFCDMDSYFYEYLLYFYPW